MLALSKILKDIDMPAKFAIPVQHPSIKGHFPGNPIVPGVVIINTIIEIIERSMPGRRVVAIKYIKFIKPLKPGVEVKLSVGKKGLRDLDIVCEGEDGVLVKGKLVLSDKELV